MAFTLKLNSMMIYVFSVINVERGVYSEDVDTRKSFMLKYLRTK